MYPFYTYLQTRFPKNQKNKTTGRWYKKQNAGVCAWKSITVWLHGKIAKGEFRRDRNASDETIYLNFKKLIFKTLLKNFHPDEALNAITVECGNQVEPASIFLKRELEIKIKRLCLKLEVLQS